MIKTTRNSKIYCSFIVLVSIVLLYTWYDLINSVNQAVGLNTISTDIEEDDSESGYANFQWCPPEYGNSSLESVIGCSALLAGDKMAIENAKKWTSPCSFTDATMMNISDNCQDFKRAFRFNRFPRSSDSARKEVDYPLAFIMIAARNAEQVVRLFQTIYRPWNLYCLTYDNHTDHKFKRTMHNLDKCYGNIVMPDTFVNIDWGGFTILQSIMNCMKVLNDDKTYNWRYVQIVSWNDFPLKTNSEMVKIMQIFNGSQDAELTDAETGRLRQFHIENNLDESKKSMNKSVPPGNLLIYKGSMSATLSREFVRFVFDNSIAKNLYNWSQTTRVPDEHYFSTLVHNLHTGVPNGFPGSCLPYYNFHQSRKLYTSRYQVWYSGCFGRLISQSCVFGVGDIQSLSTKPELIAHKMYLEFEPAAYYCLSQLNFDRTFQLTNSNYSLDLQYYENLPAVRYKNLADKSKFEC